MQAQVVDDFSWSGHRLTSEHGANTIARLTNLLDLQQLNLVNSILQSSYHEYIPWMSSYDQNHLHEFQKIKKIKGLVVTEQDDLNARKILLSSGNGKNLKKIYPSCSESMCVASNPCEVKYFANEIMQSLELIYSLNQNWKIRGDALINEVIMRIPSRSDYIPRANGTGLTTHLYRKGIFLSLPIQSDEYQLELLLNIVHEMGHLAMVTLQNFDSIIERDLNRPLYSVIRKTKRPAILSFHAMVATIYMVEFLIDLKNSNININAKSDYINTRSKELIFDLQCALNAFRKIKLTNLGQDIFNEAIGLLALAQLKLS